MVPSSQNTIELSNTCAIFAESKLVSLIAQGKSREDLARAGCRAVVKRVHSMMERIGIKRPLFFTGGVAKNQGVLATLKEEIGVPPLVPGNPFVTAALGAALVAQEKKDNPL
ncbi:MAG: hypothetical protein NTX88_11260 [Candidatus Atribacteria bacterium]|nr:hypothetical protein [Candidatus Atribacteria bacterium]